MVSYVLITAARNEEKYIERTIKSTISQTILPEKWIIVSDGSVDRTEEIVSEYANQHDFIELVCTSGSGRRNFGSKARSVNFAFNLLKGIPFEFVGNLDADISFDPFYCENILSEFTQKGQLGLAGGIRYDLLGDRFEKIKCSPVSVGGPFQIFFRECFEDIGGYVPLPYGGVDTVAEVMARMHGWQVQTFPEYRIYHYRQTGTAIGNILRSKLHNGFRDYLIGYDPVFQLLRCFSRILDKPYVIGSICWIFGYLFFASLRRKRPVSMNFIQYLRKEQKTRMLSALSSWRKSL